MSITYDEIHAQYRAIQQTHQLLHDSGEKLALFIKQANPKKLVFTGCGSSYLISCSMRSIAAMRSDLPAYAIAAGDLWLNCKRYEKMLSDALVISFSRSGMTSEVLRAIEAINELKVNASFLSIICAEGTELEKMSGFTLCMPWAFDKSVCQTRCVGNLYAAGALVIGAMTGDKTISDGIQAISKRGDAFIQDIEPLLEQLAAENWKTGVVLADAEIDGIAEEGALTFKEISQLNSNYYHILDSRHGPMVMVGEETLVIAALKSPLNDYEAALIRDIQKKGARVVCYTQQPVDLPGALCLSLKKDVGEVASGLGLLTICQLVTYFKSGFVGCNPDQPDGLDAWIKIN